MSTFLTRDQIFAAPDVETEEVHVPQWGGSVLVKAITARERDQFEMSILTGKGKNMDVVKENMRAKLVVIAVVDPDGKRIFSETDVKKLGEKSAAAIDLIYGVASRLAGLSGEDQDALAKNSVSDPNADSLSD